jgi:negative regulator of flagellin synthesis FlgM
VKIDNSIKKLGDIAPGDSRLRPQHGADKPGKNATLVDSVQLSAASLRVPLPLDGLVSRGVFDAEKVEEIKLAIAEGRLEVDPQKIADGLLAAIQDLLRAR